MNNDNQNGWFEDYGVFFVIGVVVLFFFWNFLLSNQRKADELEGNYETIEYVIEDIDERISGLYIASKDANENILSECTWQEENLGGNIGTVCSNNAYDPYNSDFESFDDTYNVDSYIYLEMLDNGEIIDNVLAFLLEDANSIYNEILIEANSMVDSLDEQCNWIEDNIDEEIADYCYNTTYEYKSANFSSSPFNINDYGSLY